MGRVQYSTLFDLPDTDQSTATKAHEYRQAVADLLLTGSLNDYRSSLSSLFGPARGKKPYEQTAEGLLGHDASKYVWRAAAYAVRYKKTYDVVSSMFRLPVYLLDQVILYASDRAITHVRTMASSCSTLLPLQPEEEHTMMTSLMKYAKRVAHTKLKFLAMYDTSTSIDDYIQDILVRARSVLWRYAHFAKEDGSRDSLKAVNYVKASIHNNAMSIIRSRTLDSKARIKNHAVGCGQCKACESGKPTTCYYSAPLYESTVMTFESAARAGTLDIARDTDIEASDARMVLARLIGANRTFAAAVSKVFGTTDLPQVLLQLDDDSQDMLLRTLSSMGVYGSDLHAQVAMV